MANITDLGLFTLPTWALPALTDGDFSGLEDEEIEMIQAFEKSFLNDGYHSMFYQSHAQKEFSHFPEFGLPCDCLEVTVYAHMSNKRLAECMASMNAQSTLNRGAL